MRTGIGTCALAALLTLAASGGEGQERGAGGSLPARVTARLTTFHPSDDYAEACGYSAAALGVEVRTRGRGYAAALVDVYRGVGGLDIGCLGGHVEEGTIAYPSQGGLHPGDMVRLGAGVGGSARGRWAGVEAEARAGLISGEPGWGSANQRPDARHLPWGGIAVGGSVLDFLVVRWEHGWTRLRFREEVYRWTGRQGDPSTFPPFPGQATPLEVREARRWHPFTGVSLGVRL